MDKILKKVKVIESSKLKARNFILFNFNRSVFAWTLGMVNDSDHPMNMKLDLSQSENLMVSTKGPFIKKKLEPRQCEFFVHTQSGFGAFNKVVNHEVEHLPRKR
jgi:hypothetical protein